jgi:hypothetical protein
LHILPFHGAPPDVWLNYCKIYIGLSLSSVCVCVCCVYRMRCLKSVKFPKLDRSPLIGGGLVTLDLSAGFVATLASSASQNSERYCTFIYMWQHGTNAFISLYDRTRTHRPSRRMFPIYPIVHQGE